jgi:hypothetical protein
VDGTPKITVSGVEGGAGSAPSSGFGLGDGNVDPEALWEAISSPFTFQGPNATVLAEARANAIARTAALTPEERARVAQAGAFVPLAPPGSYLAGVTPYGGHIAMSEVIDEPSPVPAVATPTLETLLAANPVTNVTAAPPLDTMAGARAIIRTPSPTLLAAIDDEGTSYRPEEGFQLLDSSIRGTGFGPRDVRTRLALERERKGLEELELPVNVDIGDAQVDDADGQESDPGGSGFEFGLTDESIDRLIDTGAGLVADVVTNRTNARTGVPDYLLMGAVFALIVVVLAK